MQKIIHNLFPGIDALHYIHGESGESSVSGDIFYGKNNSWFV